MGRLARGRVGWWVAGLGCSLVGPISFGLLLFLAILAFFMIVGGLGHHAQKTPPPLPNQAVFSTQWLTLIQHVDTANGFFTQYPAVVWVAAMQASSGGLPLDRTAAGGYGLYDLPQSQTMGKPLAATNAFALDLRQHMQPFLQDTLNAVGATLAPAQSNWASAVRTQINRLEQGPEIAAWPITNWGPTVSARVSPSRYGRQVFSSIDWLYPSHHRVTVVAVAAAPFGNPYTLPWRAPTTYCPPHGKCRMIAHNLMGRDVLPPVSMTLQTAAGRRVPMRLVQGPSPQYGMVYNHAVLGVSAVPVMVNAAQPVTITARWSNGASVSTTLPGSGFSQGSGGPVGAAAPLGNPKTLQQIWTQYHTALQTAARETGVPVSLLVSEAYEESRGVDYGYQGPTRACGLFQMFSPGSFTAYAPGASVQACAVPSVEASAAARYLAALHQMFGGWRVALAAYYGGPGTVQGSGVSAGMPWSQADPRLNWVPAPSSGNTESMTTYANASFAAAVTFAHAAHLSSP